MQLMLKKLTAYCLIILLIVTSLAFGDEKKTNDQKIEKYETVFVNLNSDGSRRQTIDSVWLKNSEAVDSVVDISSLKFIKPVSRAILEDDKNGELRWKTMGEDVYYQSEIDKKLPVEVKVKYKLDGEVISPEDLAGKSGHVVIHVSFVNKSVVESEINGKVEKIATPFTAVAMVGLPNDTFSNVTVDNGKLFSDGNNQMAVFIGFPALNNSLKLDKESLTSIVSIDLPEDFMIEADVQEFNLSTIGVALSPEIPDMIKDITDSEDIDGNLADIRVIIDAKDTVEKVDPTDRIKGLIKDKNQTAQAKLLIDDLFTFYDLDTSILEELPAYVTHENIALYDRIKQHLEDFHFKAVLDNEVIKYIPDRLNSENIAKARVLLDRYDELQTLDESRFDAVDEVLDDRFDLRKFFNQAENLLDDIKANQDEIDTLKTLSSYDVEISKLIKRLEKSNLDGALSQSDIQFMLGALAEKKTTEAMQSFMQLVPADGSLTPDAQVKLKNFVDQAIDSGDISTTSGGAIKMVIDKGKLPAPLRETVIDMAKVKVQTEVSTQIGSVASDAKGLLADVKRIQSSLKSDLGKDYKDKIESAIDYAGALQNRADNLKIEEERVHDKLENAREFMDNEEDILYFIDWKARLLDMKDDVDANKENVQIMKDLMTQYDLPEVKIFYDNIHIMRDDLDEARPIMESFKDLIEKPQYDREFHKSPETLNTLIKIKRDMENNKYLANTLKLSLDDRVIQSARGVLDIIDRKDNENRLDDIESDLQEIKDLKDRKEVVESLSEAYDNFSGKEKSMVSSVRFVMKTDAIEKPEVEKEYHPPVKEKRSFLKWVKGLFS